MGECLSLTVARAADLPNNTAPSTDKKPNTVMLMPDVPHELVAAHILVHLPVRSLLRFRCVCKAWHDTINDDSFIRAHLHAQNFALLIAPMVRNNSNDDDDRATSEEVVTIAGLYRWDHLTSDTTSQQQPGSSATLVHAMSDDNNNRRLFFPDKTKAHDLAHCDGLVLVPSDAKVCVLNPATHRVLTLPSSLHAVRPRQLPPRVQGHQAFGFGRDPLSNTYKVARFFYRYETTCHSIHHYTLGMEVFTLGKDKHCWRETAAPPPYPIIGGRTATFFKGSLFWTALAVSLLTNNTPAAAGFIRFNLEDESFSITPPPPLRAQELDYRTSSMAELRGELCLCVPVHHQGPGCRSMEMWMCTHLDTNNEQTRWDRRYIIRYAFFAGLRYFRPISVLDDGKTVFKAWSDLLVLCDCRNGDGGFKDMVNMKDTTYRNNDDDVDGNHTSMLVEYIDAIPYVPSLVPV